MAKRFEVVLGGERGVVEMLEDKAPQICQRFWHSLPMSSFATHAKFAGAELIVMVPFYLETEENMQESAVGDVAYYPGRQTLCIWYGPSAPLGRAPTFGKVVSGLESLARAGERILRQGSVSALVRRLDADDIGQLLAEREPLQARVRSQIAFLRCFLSEIWESEPNDVKRLRAHSRPPMGSFPCLFYANFDLFWAGENLQVCRSLAKDSSLPLEHLNKVTAALLKRTAGRLRLLSKWSVVDITTVIDDIAEFLDREGVADRDDFLDLIEHVILVISRMANWTDRVIPWSHLDSSLSPNR